MNKIRREARQAIKKDEDFAITQELREKYHGHDQPESRRIEWDDCFMSIAFILSMRSLDPSTKCGAVVVSCERDILSVGYNSPPRGCDDKKIPLTRPEKYDFMSHAEENCIVNASRIGTSLKDSTIYITSYPCERCFRMIRNAGIKKIVYFSGNSNQCIHASTLSSIDLMNRDEEGNIHVIIEEYKKSNNSITESFDLVLDYLKKKNAID